MTEPVALPWASVVKLPRSPTWRSLSDGAPWVLEKGLTGQSISSWPGSSNLGRTVWASGGAAVGVVTKLMDVHASLSTGIMAGNVPRDGGWGGLRALLESHGPLDVGVSSDYGDCRCIQSATGQIYFVKREDLRFWN